LDDEDVDIVLIATQDIHGAIGRDRVEDEILEGLVVLAKDAAQGTLDVVRLVERRGDDADGRPVHALSPQSSPGRPGHPRTHDNLTQPVPRASAPPAGTGAEPARRPLAASAGRARRG